LLDDLDETHIDAYKEYYLYLKLSLTDYISLFLVPLKMLTVG